MKGRNFTKAEIISINKNYPDLNLDHFLILKNVPIPKTSLRKITIRSRDNNQDQGMELII